GKTSIFSHPVYLFLREFSLQDFRGGSLAKGVYQNTSTDVQNTTIAS
ncbi:Rha family transcriptional regulator, partial [Escherichia coli]